MNPASFSSLTLAHCPSLTLAHCRHRRLSCHVIAAGEAVIHLCFSRAAHEAARGWLTQAYPEHPLTKAGPDFFFHRQFAEYLDGGRQTFSAVVKSPFLEKGTPFQKRVWSALTEIPYGATKTYGDIAESLGGKKYARAVGQACHNNPVALIIPCHRVIGQKGLVGFNGGISIKEQLLKREGGKPGKGKKAPSPGTGG